MYYVLPEEQLKSEYGSAISVMVARASRPTYILVKIGPSFSTCFEGKQCTKEAGVPHATDQLPPK